MAANHSAFASRVPAFMGTMVTEQSLLTPNHQKLLDSIAKNSYLTRTFYFTGGTALAEYYLHHRYSEDLDFFTEDPFAARTLEIQVKEALSILKPSSIELETLNQQHTYFLSLGSERIKVDFAYYPFAHLGEYAKREALRISSLLDIMINKVHAITTRKRGRDFLDLYLGLIKEKLNVDDIISNYQLKFDVRLSHSELAKHFAGVLEALDQPRFLGSTPWTKVEKYFLTQAKNLSRHSLT